MRGLLKHNKNLILQGAPGVGKTFTAKRLAYLMMGERAEERIQCVQFHQSYSYEDFICGYRPTEGGFSLQTGIFYDFCKKVEADPSKPYFFIIDEINRGNLSKIFGELLMLIEKDYRGYPNTLTYTRKAFSVPENLYILGMMNTADRSLAMMDYALRRRFSFYEMVPGFDSDGFKSYLSSLRQPKVNAVVECVKRLNAEIEKDEALGTGFRIGHSYFCGMGSDTSDWLPLVVKYDILPTLREYWYDEPEKAAHWETEFAGVLHDG